MTVDLDERAALSVQEPAAEQIVEAEPEVAGRRPRNPWSQRAGVLLAGVAMILAGLAGYLKWQGDSAESGRAAATESIRVATDSTIAMLSYQPETVDAQLKAAADRLTGGFREQYTGLVDTVVIPGAKQKHITAVATVHGAAAEAATENHAVVLLFINQSTTIGPDAPTVSTSSVRVTLDKVHDQWLISHFDPV